MSEKSSARQRKRRDEVKPRQASSSQAAGKPWDQRLKKRTPTCWEQYGKYFWMLLLFEFIVLLVGTIVVLCMDSPIQPRILQFPTARPLEGALAPNTILQNAKRLFEGELIGPESLVMLDGKIYTGTYDGKIVRIDDDKMMTTIAKLGREPCGTPEYEHTCGRPLGIHASDYGTLYVIDAYLGLFDVNVTGEYKQLVPSSRSYHGYPIKFGNDVTRIPGGDLFFTDSDYKWQRRDFPYIMMESSPNGRLLQFNPISQTTNVTLRDLYFANGILLSPDIDFLLICESTGYRILKYYIRGQKSGDTEIFVDNLPGIPDNIRPSSSGGYWVGIHFAHLRTGSVPILNFLAERPMLRTQLMKRNTLEQVVTRELLGVLLPNTSKQGDSKFYSLFEAMLVSDGFMSVIPERVPLLPITPDYLSHVRQVVGPCILTTCRRCDKESALSEKRPFLPIIPDYLSHVRQEIMKPHFLLQFLPKYGMVIELSKDGEIINSLHDPTGEVIDSVSEVLDTGDALYLGSFKSPFLAKLDYKSKSSKDKLNKK